MTRRTREKLTSASVTSSHLSQISEVVSLHFEVKHLTFCVTGLWNEVFVQETLKKAKFNCVWCTKMYSRQSLTGNMGTHKVTQIRKMKYIWPRSLQEWLTPESFSLSPSCQQQNHGCGVSSCTQHMAYLFWLNNQLCQIQFWHQHL